jgi:hypothetical protein
MSSRATSTLADLHHHPRPTLRLAESWRRCLTKRPVGKAEQARALQVSTEYPKAIELWPCGYDAPCKVKSCKARATTIARAVDAGGRPIRQYELCATHATVGNHMRVQVPPSAPTK